MRPFHPASLVLLDLLAELDAEDLVGEAGGDAEEGGPDPDEGDDDLLLGGGAVLDRPHRLPGERRGHVEFDGGGNLGVATLALLLADPNDTVLYILPPLAENTFYLTVNMELLCPSKEMEISVESGIGPCIGVAAVAAPLPATAETTSASPSFSFSSPAMFAEWAIWDAEAIHIPLFLSEGLILCNIGGLESTPIWHQHFIVNE